MLFRRVSLFREILGSRHRQRRRHPSNEPGHADHAVIIKGQREPGQSTGQLHQCVVEAKHHRADIAELFLMDHGRELRLVAGLVSHDAPGFGQFLHELPVIFRGVVFSSFHQIDHEHETKNLPKHHEQPHPEHVGFGLNPRIAAPYRTMQTFIVRHLFKDFAVFLQTGLFCQRRVHALVSGLVVLHPADNG